MAHIDATDINGNTPLHLAASNGHGDVVDILMEHGADASIVNRNGFTASQLAHHRGHCGIGRMIDEYASRSPAPLPGTPPR